MTDNLRSFDSIAIRDEPKDDCLRLGKASSVVQTAASVLQIGIGAGLCVVLNDAMSLALMSAGILLPGSVAGLIVLLIALLVTPGDHLSVFLRPSANVLLRWLPLLFVPALVDFPLIVPMIPAWDYPKIAVIVVVGILFTSTISGWTLLAVGHLHFKLTGFKQAVIFPEQHHAPSRSRPLLGVKSLAVCLLAMLVFTIVFSWVPRMRSVALFVVMLLTMPATYAMGQYAPIRFPNGCYPNPILTSGALSILMAYVLSLGSGTPVLDLLKSVHSGGSMNLFMEYSPNVGAGDVYLYLLNASVVSMALSVYSQKHALLVHGLDMLLASVIVAISSIVFTIGLCRVTFVSPSVARSMALRTVTAPIAMASITFIQGLSGVAGAVSVITGVAGGVVWKRLVDLRWNRFSSPLIRGFSIGSSCHGMGTAILSLDEPDSTPFSTVAFVAVGVASSSMISLSAFRTMIESILQ